MVRNTHDLQKQHYIQQLEEALYGVLDTGRLDIAKEIAAEALGEDLDMYLEKDLKELDFIDNEFPDGETDYSLLELDDQYFD